jgi:hypothetical protein
MNDADFMSLRTMVGNASFDDTKLTICRQAISANTVTIVGLGTCTLQAFQAGNANYSAAPLVTRSFNISGGTVTNNIVFTLAGDGTAAFAGDGGPASAASLNGPTYSSFQALRIPSVWCSQRRWRAARRLRHSR